MRTLLTHMPARLESTGKAKDIRCGAHTVSICFSQDATCVQA